MDGVSVREHLTKVMEQTGKTPKRLDLEPLPQYILTYLSLWQEISAGRTQTGMGLTPLSWQDMLAWSSLTRVRLTPFEVSMIRLIDSVWMETYRSVREKEAEAPPDG